ncbi:hypothetical protein SGLAM104S_02587 [Streptomyces glaucescens]
MGRLRTTVRTLADAEGPKAGRFMGCFSPDRGIYTGALVRCVRADALGMRSPTRPFRTVSQAAAEAEGKALRPSC